MALAVNSEFKGTYAEYHAWISAEYFPYCKGASVLEIGAQQGHHSINILSHAPTQLDIIEGNHHSVNTLNAVLGKRAQVIHDDAQYALVNYHPVDVVICFGVLYHLHSPLHLLELIVNVCSPKYIILDTVRYDGHGLDAKFVVEPVNELGMQQTRSNFKYAGYKLYIDEEVIAIALQNMGYTPLRTDHVMVSDNFSKSRTWAGIWQNKETL